MKPEPTNFEELKRLSLDQDNFNIYKTRTCPTGCFKEDLQPIPCDILDKDMNIIDKCWNPIQAWQKIQELVQTNNGFIEDYCILNLQTMHCIPLHKVMT